MGDPVLRAYQVSSLEDRVDILRGLVWGKEGGLKDPLMRRIGLLVTRACPPRSDTCELKAVFDFVAKNIRYSGDVATKDTFQSALRTMQLKAGDCDDHSQLCAVLAMENGFSCKWRITSNTGATWDHIYCMAGVPKHAPREWIALDTTLGTGKFSNQPRYAKRKDFMVATE